MTEYLTEQEQIEILKNWIKQYSFVILAGIAIALITITGWRYWQENQNKKMDQASAYYDEMLSKRAQNDVQAEATNAQKLLQQYPKTVFAQMAALMLSHNAVSKQTYPEAQKYLQWILDKSSIAPFRQIARLRLARVLIAEGQYDEAIKTLKTIEDKNFNGLTNEVKGDAYLAMKQIDEARKAYAQALKDLPNAESTRPLLQMKYDNLTTTNSAS